jgi:hypothetical protein
MINENPKPISPITAVYDVGSGLSKASLTHYLLFSRGWVNGVPIGLL